MELAAQCTSLANDLAKEEPTMQLALASGIKDYSYDTTDGRVESYRGATQITMESGQIWLAVGHRPKGTPESVHKQGWIEFIPQSKDTNG